jgi:diguanylate cyclase (GGDEF)-like protein
LAPRSDVNQRDRRGRGSYRLLRPLGSIDPCGCFGQPVDAVPPPEHAASGARRCQRWRFLLLLFLLLGNGAHADESFQQDLERATKLSVTAPWQQTQEVLDVLRPRLGSATDRQRADFLQLQARNLSLAGRLEDSLRVVDELLAVPLNRAQNIRAHGLGANVAMLARRYERSFELLGKGLALEPDLDDPDGLVGLLSVASYIHAQAGQPQRAIEYGLRSLEFAQVTGNVRDRCVTTQRIAFAYKVAADPTQAEAFYRRAIEACEEAGDPVFGGVAKSGLGDLLRQQGRLDEADAMFAQAIAGLEAAGFSVGLAEARYYQARLLLARGQFDAVRDNLAGLADGFRTRAHWDYLAESNRMLAEVARREGDAQTATALLLDALDAREKHLDRERSLHLAFLGVEFDLQFKEQELALLREQARGAQLQEEAQRQRLRLHLLGATVAILTALVLALLLLHTRRERRRLLDLSRHDGLTGLNNHTWFFEIAGEELQNAHRDGRPLTLLLTDIDFFKQVNDLHGHPAGDEVLRRVAELLRESFDAHGSIGRIGGEEFGISLPSTSVQQAQSLLQQFRVRLAQANPGPEGGPITMSFGVAGLRDGENFDQLRARADDALYGAKQTGRDRVVVAADPPPSAVAA